MLKKRIVISVVSGMVLGLICIAGALVRSGFQSESSFLIALWYNRLVMGLMIGLAGKSHNGLTLTARGAFLGLIVSLAFYLSTGLQDAISFAAGIVYGIIIEWVAFKWGE